MASFRTTTEESCAPTGWKAAPPSESNCPGPVPFSATRQPGPALWTPRRRARFPRRRTLPPLTSLFCGIYRQGNELTFHHALELTTGSINVTTARPPDEGWNSSARQHLLKRQHTLRRWRSKGDARTGIERYQVHLGPDPPNSFRYLARLRHRIVHTVEQHIFERQPFTQPQGEGPRRLQQHPQVPLPVDGHDARAQFVVGRVQRNRQLRPDRFLPEIEDAGHDARRGKRHPRLRNADALYQ